jgi:hypothetical protein
MESTAPHAITDASSTTQEAQWEAERHARHRREEYRLVLNRLPIGAAVAMKQFLWQFLDGPDVSGHMHVDMTLDIDISEADAERLYAYLEGGWFQYELDKRSNSRSRY